MRIRHLSDIVIIGAKRTPVGSFLGAFASTPAHELGRQAILAALAQAGVAPEEVDEVILGQVLAAGQGQNPARQAAVNAGIPVDRTAIGINQLCGSGLRSVALAAQAIRSGDARIMIAGGQESMSMAPHAQFLRAGAKMGAVTLFDTMIHDGLTDAFNNYHMGVTAENLAEKYQISREAQDEFAVGSQNKASAARASGRFKDEIVPVTVKGRKGDTIVDTDEYIRDGATIEAMSALKPAFKKDGTVTAGNASTLNDGAAAVLLMSAERAKRLNLPVLARIQAYASSGVDPSIMGIAPVTATRSCLEKAGWSLDDVELIEANEAFAAQALSVGKELGWNAEKVNVNGGAVALGHPIGASGARVLVTLLHEMLRRDAKKGLATLCIGGGQGVAMALVRD